MKLLFLIGFLITNTAQARIFDINRETVAAYFRTNWGPSLVKKTAFEKASSSTETIDGEAKDNFAGEFGFVYASRYLGLKFGIEVIRPPSLKGMTATNASGTDIYTLTSDVSVVIPKVGLEFILRQWKVSRLFFAANFGSGNLTVNNAYYFTADQSAAMGGITEYTEEGKATATAIDGGIGFETLLFDTTTMVLDAGYRSLKFTGLTHNRSATTIQGAKVKGDPFLNADGTARDIDLTGYYVGLAFRFWL